MLLQAASRRTPAKRNAIFFISLLFDTMPSIPMIVTPIQTVPIHANEFKLTDVLHTYLQELKEHEVLVITSKIISLCEGNVVDDSVPRDTLIGKESDYYIAEKNPYEFHMTIKNNTLIASTGVDLSNGDGHYVLWPKNLQKSANEVREYLCARFGIKEVGVVITDSHVMPLRWGTVGTCIAHSGFSALNSYIGTPDLFGRKLKVTNSNVAEGLAASAVLCMGEGAECTPLTKISDVPFVHFQDRNPTSEELSHLAISMKEDIFSPLLTAVSWKKGNQ